MASHQKEIGKAHVFVVPSETHRGRLLRSALYLVPCPCSISLSPQVSKDASKISSPGMRSMDCKTVRCKYGFTLNQWRTGHRAWGDLCHGRICGTGCKCTCVSPLPHTIHWWLGKPSLAAWELHRWGVSGVVLAPFAGSWGRFVLLFVKCTGGAWGRGHDDVMCAMGSGASWYAPALNWTLFWHAIIQSNWL